MILPDELLIRIDRRLDPVGLRRWFGSLQPEPWLAAPEGAQAWLGVYAIVLAVPVSADQWRSKASMGARWLGDLQDAWWRHGELLDAYLLLVLPECPGESQVEELRRYELKTNICRRHVLWPEKGGPWDRRLDEVTILDIPLPERGGAAPASSDLTRKADWVLDRFKEKGKRTEVWKALEQEIEREAREDGHAR